MLEIEPISINFHLNLPTSFPGEKEREGESEWWTSTSDSFPSPQRGIVFSDTRSHIPVQLAQPRTQFYTHLI